MKPYDITLNFKIGCVNSGSLFIGENALYFVSQDSTNLFKQGMGASVGRQLGGFTGELIGDRLSKSVFGDGTKEFDINLPESYTEENLTLLAEQNEHCYKFEASNIQLIQSNMWLRILKYNGKRYGIMGGISKELKKALKPWAEQHGIKTKGIK